MCGHLAFPPPLSLSRVVTHKSTKLIRPKKNAKKEDCRGTRSGTKTVVMTVLRIQDCRLEYESFLGTFWL